jgi:hypothetical protein
MICGLVMMAVTSTRHISLLALIGCICFARIFSMFCPYLKPDVKDSVYEKLQQNLQNELNDFAITINQRFSSQEENT